MHLPTLIVITLILNALLGLLMVVIYDLSKRKPCFLYWALSCLVFSLGIALASARVSINLPVVTYGLANLMLLAAPILAILGIRDFIGADAPLQMTRTRSLVLFLLASLLLGASYPDKAVFSAMTSLLMAGCFAIGALWIRQLPVRNTTPRLLLLTLYVAHTVVMLMLAGLSLSAAPEAGSGNRGWVYELVLASHILLTTGTAMLFPLLVYVATEQRLKRLANQDELTELFNRRAFFNLSDGLFNDSVRVGTDFSVLMVDLDYFKKVNDQWGHAVGDQCLQLAARTLQTQLREQDILARLGGEEFAVTLPGIDAQEAEDIAQRLCRCLAHKPLMVNGQAIQITASVGGIQRHNGHTNVQGMLVQADHALYSAKSKGRNKVIFHHPVQASGPTQGAPA
ncbi:sensor domain-containing diguanylate cyclase [Saccharospirillum alexandrii]|uniref:sensor domain-containing diguanylate cyclase n=1 Tax=Saccharospirillum alexandrii TaxID=2448477 RepID=UPI000FD7F6AA|nr:GGDEF domain-containing protein [Saccharospirillum alexandrii]